MAGCGRPKNAACRRRSRPIPLGELDRHVANLGPVSPVRDLSGEAQSIVAATLGTTGAIDGDSVFTVIGQLLDSVDAAVRSGEWAVAERTRIQAYGLVDAGPELSLPALDPPLAALIDGLFWSGAQRSVGLATVIAAQAPFPKYLAAAGELRGALLQALFLRAGADTVLAGVLLGSAAVAAVGVVTLHLEKKLPHNATSGRVASPACGLPWRCSGRRRGRPATRSAARRGTTWPAPRWWAGRGGCRRR